MLHRFRPVVLRGDESVARVCDLLTQAIEPAQIHDLHRESRWIVGGEDGLALSRMETGGDRGGGHNRSPCRHGLQDLVLQPPGDMEGHDDDAATIQVGPHVANFTGDFDAGKFRQLTDAPCRSPSHDQHPRVGTFSQHLRPDVPDKPTDSLDVGSIVHHAEESYDGAAL